MFAVGVGRARVGRMCSTRPRITHLWLRMHTLTQLFPYQNFQGTSPDPDSMSGPERTGRAASDTPTVWRKHRPGLQRVQIASERCRKRKIKYAELRRGARKMLILPSAIADCPSTACVPCIILARPRGYVDGLEADVQRLHAQIEWLQQEAQALRDQLKARHDTQPQVLDVEPQARHPSPIENADGFAENINLVPHEVILDKKCVGGCSDLFFGNTVQAVLTQAD